LPEHEADGLFLQLLMVFEAQAMVQLGKVVNPASQEVTRDLDGAKATISLIEMLERKTKGNLSADEEGLVRRMLTGLRMNYLDELSRGKRADEKADEAEEESGAESERTPTDEAASQDKGSNKGSLDEPATADGPPAGDAEEEDNAS
jgi:hypothetical protein